MDDSPPAADSAYVVPVEADGRRVFDLTLKPDRPPKPAEECAAATGDEIVVCGRPEED